MSICMCYITHSSRVCKIRPLVKNKLHYAAGLSHQIHFHLLNPRLEDTEATDSQYRTCAEFCRAPSNANQANLELSSTKHNAPR